MTETDIITLMRDAMWVAAVIASPILGVALLSGLTIGLLQALTSIQELTLTFVPKLFAIALVFWISMSFMAQGVIALWTDEIIPRIAAGG